MAEESILSLSFEDQRVRLNQRLKEVGVPDPKPGTPMLGRKARQRALERTAWNLTRAPYRAKEAAAQAKWQRDNPELWTPAMQAAAEAQLGPEGETIRERDIREKAIWEAKCVREGHSHQCRGHSHSEE